MCGCGCGCGCGCVCVPHVSWGGVEARRVALIAPPYHDSPLLLQFVMWIKRVRVIVLFLSVKKLTCDGVSLLLCDYTGARCLHPSAPPPSTTVACHLDRIQDQSIRSRLCGRCVGRVDWQWFHRSPGISMWLFFLSFEHYVCPSDQLFGHHMFCVCVLFISFAF